MRCGTSTRGKELVPRRSKRQRIDLTSEEGFDRHELERALRQSLQEERTKEKQKSNRRKLKAVETTAIVRLLPERRTVGDKTVKKTEKNKDNFEKEFGPSRIASRREPALVNKTKPSPPKNTSEEFQSSSEEVLEAFRNATLKRKPNRLDTTKCNEVTLEEDIIKSEVVVSRREFSKKYSPKEKQASSTGVTIKEGEVQLEREKAIEELLKTKRDFVAQRFPSYRIPTEAGDLITLLACSREVIGDHESSCDSSCD